MQTYGNPPGQQKPQRFIPRRDLFPEEFPPAPPPSIAKSSAADRTSAASAQNSEAARHAALQASPAVMGSTFSPLLFLFLLMGWMLLKPRILYGKLSIQGTEPLALLQDAAENPRYQQMLKDAAPYLEQDEQAIAYSLAGAFEIASGIRDLLNRTYHHRCQIQAMGSVIPSDPTAKRIGLLKAVMPHLPEDQEAVSQVVKAYETADRLYRNMKIFHNNRVLAQGTSDRPIETVLEILNVLHPVLPPETRSQSEKILTILRMAEALKLGPAQASKQTAAKKAGSSTSPKGSTQKKASADEGGNQMESMIHSLKSILNEEQQETMDVLMQMAKLLSGPSE